VRAASAMASSSAPIVNGQRGASTRPHARADSCPRCSKWPASYPKTVNGHEPPPLIGKSWSNAGGEEDSPRSGKDTCVGNFGNHAVRQGWKLVWQYSPMARNNGSVQSRADPGNAMIWPPRNLTGQAPGLWMTMLAQQVILPTGNMGGQAKQMPDRYPVWTATRRSSIRNSISADQHAGQSKP